MNLGKLLKKLWKFAIDNYFISIFLACILFVGVVSIYKLFLTKPTYVYAKVKVSQGLWWAATQKPSIWFVKAIKKGDVEADLVGKPLAEILSVRYYPWYGTSQYDIYLTLRLKVSGNKKTGNYSFNRSTIGVGSPIDLEFPKTQFSGTIIELNENPLQDQYVDKIVYLTKRNAYPWEFDAIEPGDSYSDGQDIIFKILDKKATDTSSIMSDTFGNYTSDLTEGRKYIIVKAEIKVKQTESQLIFAEEQVVSLGKTLNISTNNFTFTDYIISKVE